LGSLIKRQALSVGWRSYNEFLSSFYYPLRLCEKRLINLYKLLYLIRGDAAGIAEMATLVNPLFSIVGVRFTGKIFKLISIYRAGPSFEREKIDAKFSNPILKMIAKFILKSMWFPCRRPNIILLAERIKSINLRQKTEWGNYHAQAGFYGEDGNITLSPRMDWVRGVVAELRPRSIIELAGNQGILSRILAQVPGVEKVICSDYDENSIDALLLNSRDDEKVSMACFDFMAGTWQALSNERADRLRSEMVIALAVTHHLILSQNFSIDSILSAIINYSSKYLIIEFMPLGLWGGNSAPPLPAWYSEAWFVNNLNRYCEIIQRIDLEPNRIAFVAKIKGSS